MSIELAIKYGPYTDDVFKAESKTSLLTNTDYDWTGAHSIAVFKVSTVPMQDYSRKRSEITGGEDISRFGKLVDLAAQTEELLLSKDRSFIFNVDKLDTDETAGQVEAQKALGREVREVVIPEIDKYVYGVMTSHAGTTASEIALTAENIYDQILAGSKAPDDAEVPDTERVLVVTPATYTLLKKAVGETPYSDVAADMRTRGVVGMVDGMAVVKVPASRLPEKFGFMIAHPSATVAPVKLEDYGLHNDTPLSSGTIVTGRIVYDAFVLDNKAKGIYYQPLPAD